MSNTENTSHSSTSRENPVLDNAPAVTVNTANPSAPSTNRPNPNMVMALVICFLLIIGLALAFVFKLNEESGGDGKSSVLTEKEKLQRLIDAERGGTAHDMRATSAALEGRISSILENASAIQSEFEIMKTGYLDAQDKLNQAGNELQGNMSTISRLGSENTALKGQIRQLQDLAREAQIYQSQAQQYATMNAEKDALIATLQNRPSGENMNQMQKMLNDEQATKEKLLQKSQELEQQVAALLTQNEELRKQLQTLQTSVDYGKLFVKSYKSLPENAQALYNELKSLEGAKTADLPEAYTRMASELNAVNLQRVRFATGSSILNFTDQKTIKNKLDTTEASDYFLVVGYASVTGDAASNETLSANRATAVASVVHQLKKDGQDVRAVYLGQTDRFSKDEHAANQLCEVWRIRK